MSNTQIERSTSQRCHAERASRRHDRRPVRNQPVDFGVQEACLFQHIPAVFAEPWCMPGYSTLGIEMLKHKAGIDIVSIPYQGGGPAVTALIANEIQILMDAPGGTILSSIETGTLRPLACSGAARHKALPNVPTTREAGFPDLQITVTSGFWAPAGIAPDRVKILGDAFRSAVETPSVSERIAKLGTFPQPAAAAELLERTRAERAFWIEAARLSNYQAN